MNDGALPVTSNHLDIRNPFRLHGMVQIAAAFVLGLILVLRLPTLYPRMLEFVNVFQRDPARALGNPTALLVAIQGVFVVFAAVLSLVCLIQGIHRYFFKFFVPPNVPKGIQARDQALRNIFIDRVITSYRKPTWLVGLLAPKRWLYTTGIQRALVNSLIGSLKTWALLFVAAFFLRLPGDLFLSLTAVGLLSIIARFIAVLALIPPTPDVQVLEVRDHLDNTGNPINFFNHIGRTLEQLRRGNFPNRHLSENQPTLGRMSTGETSDFKGNIIVETQPLPDDSRTVRAAVILDLGGVILWCGGYGAILFTTPAQGRGMLGDIALQMLVGLAALISGSKALEMGRRLHSVFRFHSDLVAVNVNGTHTASGIGIGDGRGGQLFSQRVIMQSDTHVHTYGSRIVTECEGLRSERTIVDAQVNPDFEQRFEHLRTAMLTFEDTGSKLAGVDLANPDLSNIVRANLEMTAMQARTDHGVLPADSRSQLPEIPAPTAAPQLPAPAATDLKVCPDCGEQVKAIAQKCRFCSYRFDQVIDLKT